MMVDYNDGKWHGWNGGECPVHPETVVEYVYRHNSRTALYKDKAGSCAWYEDCKVPIIAFRVVEEHRAPREFWCHEVDGQLFTGYESTPGAFKVREVIE